MTNNPLQKTVSVIGLGQMGQKIARLYISAGYRTTVYNRTLSKAKSITDAFIAENALSAVAASDVVVICVLDNNAVMEVLSDIPDQKIFQDKIFINATTGTPGEATKLSEFLASRNATLLQAALQVAPDQMGMPDTTIIIAGNEKTYLTIQPLLTVMGGNLRHVGQHPAAASAMDLATLAWVYASFTGLMHGAALCRKSGLSLEQYSKLIGEITPGFTEFFRFELDAIDKDDYSIRQSPMSISITASARIEEALASAGLLPGFGTSIANLFREAERRGLKEEEVAGLIKVIS